jgi:hypothetical protein
VAGRPDHQQNDAQESHGKKECNYAGDEPDSGAQKEFLHKKQLCLR